MRRTILVFGCTLMMACGQSGDLFLPQNQRPETVDAEAAEVPDQSTDETKEDDQKTPAG